MNYFYDEQLRRYLLQFLRVFSDINIRTAPDDNGVSIQKRVPVIYGDMSRQVASIINGNNQNTVIPVPIMAGYITGLDLAPDYRVDTQGVKVSNVTELATDANGSYINKPGNRYTVEAYMPVPYKLTTRLDILTSNTDNKLQILEQILVLFNPSIQLEQNQNPLDWSRIFELELKETQWSNRTIPVGTSTDYDISSLIFQMIVYINPPAKVKKQKIINTIISNIYTDSFSDIKSTTDFFNVTPGTVKEQLCVTPGNYGLRVIDNKLTLLNTYGDVSSDSWDKLLNIYGSVEQNVTTVKLIQGNIDNPDIEIIGYIEPSSTNTTTFTPIDETLPSATIPPINRIIDPSKMFPGNKLPEAQIGQRYMVLNSLTKGEEPAIKNSYPWGNSFVAYDSDIIEYTGTQWVVTFNARVTNNSPVYVRNLYDKELYKFKDREWQYGYAGDYKAGYWRVDNICSIS
ncbi:hypothetical protein RVBP17_0730 [Pseudomonas phage sp. 30-3]|nr:hypothetical protein RVBP16_3240 [Pseudomonas phage sp. 30-2]BDR26030.1 hypothetical protein RVBP17_0730 [Pseudomonas phage sp. 30-3]VOH53471.1 Possible phage tail sheath completion protein [Pseudomonas phage vB_PaeM_MIJ3]